MRVITPDVGGGFGAKIGADPEFALVGWLAKRMGRPVRWSETRSENMIGMLHGRGQRQTVTIGGTRDGTVLAYRLDIVARTRAPIPGSARSCPTSRRSMAPAVYDIPQVESRARVVATDHDLRSAPTAARAGPRRPRRSSGRWTCSPPRSAWTPPRSAGAT